MEENGSPKWSEITQQLGEPERTAFSNYRDSSMTYIYASEGLAYVADANMDVKFIETRFIPMSIEDYMQTLGSTLPLKNPFTK